jgi:hypothetical protein
MGNGLYSDARVLTLLELMILHTIPIDKIVVNDTYTEHFVRELIGESIPPLMVRKLFDKQIVKEFFRAPLPLINFEILLHFEDTFLAQLLTIQLF